MAGFDFTSVISGQRGRNGLSGIYEVFISIPRGAGFGAGLLSLGLSVCSEEAKVSVGVCKCYIQILDEDCWGFLL